MKAKDFRAQARESLKGNYWTMVVICLIIVAVTALEVFVIRSDREIPGAVVPVTYNALMWVQYLVTFLIGVPLTFGGINACLKIVGKKEAEIKDVFVAFKSSKTFGKVAGAGFLTAVYTALWTLLFIVPGIIKIFSYSMTMYLLRDNPNMGANEAIAQSRKLMKGNKWRLFCLEISFFGWYIVATLTAGVGLVFLMPYVQTAVASFYEEIREKTGEEVLAQSDAEKAINF